MVGVRGLLRIGAGLAVCLTLVVPPGSWAQTAAEKKAAARLGTEVQEVVVTAQKREESIQETPLSVTAITSQTLEAKGIVRITDVGEVAPNVRTAIGGGTQSGTVISIRGAVQANPNLSFQPAAALYVDGVYLTGIQGTNLDLEDVERVEVLRGPQGTLYGRNTIAGAINFITKKPTEERAITATSEVGNFNYFKSRVTLNLPLIGKNGFFQSDAIGTLSLRETVTYNHHDGYFDNVSPTSVKAGGSSSFNNLNRVFTMTSLRWQPIKPLTLDYSFEYHRYREANAAFQLTYTYPNSPVAAGRPFDLTPYVRQNRVDAWGNNVICNSPTGDLTNCTRLADDGNHRLQILTASYELGDLGALGGVTVKSISAYRNLRHQTSQDLDGSPLHAAETSVDNLIEHWSEELQWVGTAPRVHYVLGGYYYGEDDTQNMRQAFLGGATNLPSNIKIKNESYAPYGQVTVTPPILGDRLSLTGGLRYTQEQVHMDRFSHCVTVINIIGGRPVNLCNNPAIPVPSLKDWTSSRGKAFGGTDGISPMGNIAYQWTDDLMTYFRIARGFKGGGFNGTATDPRAFAIPFDPEKLLQYELGFKSQWIDNRLRINAAGYYSDYTDLQESAFRASREAGVLSVTSNAEAAEIWGSEIEIAAIPVRGVEVTGSYGLTLPKFLKWTDQKFDANNSPIFDQNGNPVLENVASQRSFPYVPEHQASASLSYTAPPMSSGTFSAHLDAFWQDKVVFIVNNTTAGAHAVSAANHIVVNGRVQLVGIPVQKGSLDLALFGRNLFDKKYRVTGVDLGQSLGWGINIYGDPRTFGLQLTYNFSEG